MEKEQKSYLTSRKGDKNLDEIYETCLTNDLDLKKSSNNLYQKKINNIIKIN